LEEIKVTPETIFQQSQADAYKNVQKVVQQQVKKDDVLGRWSERMCTA
jgi:hypothetical protein